MKPSPRFVPFLLAALAGLFLETASANPVVRFHTDLGDIDVVLLADVAPNTVANFLGYVNRHDYDNSFIHRSVANFVIQGGGYRYDNVSTSTIPQQAPVANEFHVSNTRGTLAMAKVGGDPNSATSQWFFNLSDSNAANLDTQNGGFTVFGRILDSSGLSMLDTLAAVPVYNAGSPFDSLPLKNYTSGAITTANLVNLISVRELIMPTLTASRPTATSVHLTVTGTQGTAYAIQSSTSLEEGSFSTFATVTTDATGSGSYDGEGSATDARRFYRIVIP